MFLAARRYDVLGRKFQIATEVRAMYADALAHAATRSRPTLRDLFWCRYWMWELRDAYEDLAPLYARAWRYESRDGHLASNLERYHARGAASDRARRRVLSRDHAATCRLEDAAAARPSVIVAMTAAADSAWFSHVFAVLMYRRWMPALVAVPAMAIADVAGGRRAVARARRHRHRRRGAARAVLRRGHLRRAARDA